MQNSVLESMGAAAGLGGLSLGVLLILFREVIRKKIFPNLTKEQAYNLLRLVLVLVFAIAAIGIGTYAYVTISTKQIEIGGKTFPPKPGKEQPLDDFINVTDSLIEEIKKVRAEMKEKWGRIDDPKKIPQKTEKFMHEFDRLPDAKGKNNDLREFLNRGDIKGAEHYLSERIDNYKRSNPVEGKQVGTASFILGCLKELQLDYDNAKKYFEDAVKYDSSNANYLNRLNSLLKEMKLPAKTVEQPPNKNENFNAPSSMKIIVN